MADLEPVAAVYRDGVDGALDRAERHSAERARPLGGLGVRVERRDALAPWGECPGRLAAVERRPAAPRALHLQAQSE
jgi:hypothetical protein